MESQQIDWQGAFETRAVAMMRKNPERGSMAEFEAFLETEYPLCWVFSMLKKLGIGREELAAGLSAADVEFANDQLKDVLDVDLEILAAKVGFRPTDGLQDFSVAVRDWRMKGLERLCAQAGIRFWAAFFVLERHWRNCGCPGS